MTIFIEHFRELFSGIDLQSERDYLSDPYHIVNNDHNQNQYIHHHAHSNPHPIRCISQMNFDNEQNNEIITDHPKMNRLMIVNELDMIKQTNNNNNKYSFNIPSSGYCYGQQSSINPYIQENVNNYLHFHEFTSSYLNNINNNNNNNDNKNNINEMINVMNKQHSNLNYPPIYSMSNTYDKPHLIQDIPSLNQYEKNILNLTTQSLTNNLSYSCSSCPCSCSCSFSSLYTLNPDKLITTTTTTANTTTEPSTFSRLNFENTIENNVNIIDLNKQINPWINYSMYNNQLIPNIITSHSTQNSIMNTNPNNNNDNNTTVWSPNEDHQIMLELYNTQNDLMNNNSGNNNNNNNNNDSSYEESLSDDNEQNENIHQNNIFYFNINNQYPFNQFHNNIDNQSIKSIPLKKSSTFISNHLKSINSMKSIHSNEINLLNYDQIKNSIINPSQLPIHLHHSFINKQYLNHNNNIIIVMIIYYIINYLTTIII
ncbi:unnamed protein product [Schistosoma haematobium]|nr:unnamed protein product [Schistosoma haematobium]